MSLGDIQERINRRFFQFFVRSEIVKKSASGQDMLRSRFRWVQPEKREARTNVYKAIVMIFTLTLDIACLWLRRLYATND
jgi:hypothetical protein